MSQARLPNAPQFPRRTWNAFIAISGSILIRADYVCRNVSRQPPPLTAFAVRGTNEVLLGADFRAGVGFGNGPLTDIQNACFNCCSYLYVRPDPPTQPTLEGSTLCGQINAFGSLIPTLGLQYTRSANAMMDKPTVVPLVDSGRTPPWRKLRITLQPALRTRSNES